MNPFERWDEWEWEKAAHELGRQETYNTWYSGNSYTGPKYYFSDKGPPKNFVEKWTGSQKRVVLAALLFLTVIFSAKGEDIVSRGVYTVYRNGMDNGSIYTALNTMARDAMGLTETESIPVDAGLNGIFYPPVAGVVKVGFNGKGYNGQVSRGIEIESALGTPVLCPEEGVVLEVKENEVMGRTVRINFGGGWEGVLGNLGEVLVKRGEPVAMGEQIGTVGMTSCRNKPWLYFELLKNGKPVDPIPCLFQK